MSKLPVQWPPHAKRWLVAVSGGLDSMCLLHLAYQLQQADSTTPSIEVVHVNHGLQKQGDDWQAIVEQQARAYGFVCHSRALQIAPSSLRASGVEGAARDARYGVFADIVQADDVLLLAQHADDQVETFFLRLLRGAGVAGLAAMPQSRPLGAGRLFRPLLGVSRRQLEDYAQDQGLAWVEDPSNADERFERNYLRHQIMPALRQRWPSVAERVATTSEIMQDTQVLLQEVAEQDLGRCQVEVAGGGLGLSVRALLQLTEVRRNNLLRSWLLSEAGEVPAYDLLRRINDEVLLAAVDGQPEVVLGAGRLVRSYDVVSYLGAAQETAWQAPEVLLWQGQAEEQAVAFAGGWLVPVRGGIVLQQGDLLVARKREGGERCQPCGRDHSQTLKKLLQEYRVPAWQRDQLPLIYRNDEWVMVADLWVNQGFVDESVGLTWGWSRQQPSNPGRED